MHVELNASPAVTAVSERLRAALASRYTVGDAIGEGATSFIFRAHDLRYDRPVAVKVLRPELVAQVGPDRFLREIRIAARLTHPHIIALLDSGETDGLLYYVMPYSGGESLRALLARVRQLPLVDALRIAREVASALDYAHAQGIVHRDVKPGNILLVGGVACVTDFGLASALLQEDSEALTTSGVAVGTPAYMSPEQANGDLVDSRADQYSLGCVVFEMLAGMPPFQGASVQTVLWRHRVDVPPRLEHLRATIPRGVADAVARALAKLPADRHSGVEAFAEALDAALMADMVALGSRTPVTNREVSQGTSIQLPARRTRRALAIAAGLALAMSGLAIWYLFGRGHDGSPLGGGVADLDSDRLAVAPFQVVSSEDTLWRHGLVDLLSRTFDGAGPLRTVPPSVVVKGWRGGADVRSANALGRRTGARLVVFGQLIRAGNDSARLIASLLDVKESSIIGEADLRDELSRVERLADSLTVRLLRELGKTRPIASLTRGSIGSRSLPALKAFLQGEQYYRRNDLVRARESYERALQHDTAFTLAMHRMRSVLRASVAGGGEFDADSREYAFRAGQRNVGLAPRDSLLVAADSLAATFTSNAAFVDDEWVGRLRRRVGLLEQAVRRYPSDPQSWDELGEARFHFGERFGIEEPSALDAFERAIVLDSAFGKGYFHAIELSSVLRGSEVARRHAEAYRRVNPEDARLRLVASLLSPAAGKAGWLQRQLASASFEELGGSAYLLRRTADSGEVALQILRDLARTGRERELIAGASVRVWLTVVLLFRGHFREAYRTAPEDLAAQLPSYFVQLALVGAIPPRDVKRVTDSWRTGGELLLPLHALSWWHARADTASLRQVAQRFDSVARLERGQAGLRRLAEYGAGAARAYLALASRDTAGALEAFAALPDSLCPWWCVSERLTYARTLANRSRIAEAASVLDRRPPAPASLSMYEVIWTAQRAALALSSGDRERAKRFFTRVVDTWSRGDPAAQETVAVARSALQRLR